ncbi:conserved unknown protein [Ectocarpus siliculosus]|uniref:Coiled-coil domain-containing protein 40 n=1 Tax=Ectocarpus siliculosus TaxID=2880 RepID=D7FUW3_ECTSI|nr:conserved unknown protein [Ectocarpus siliculosus]|eukprot:CBJ31769.1 conserved unknown protein [Ectocarpus siliculosus]
MAAEPQQQQLSGFGEQLDGEGGAQGEQGWNREEEEEEDAYEDPEEMIREFGRHPMMDRVQEALYNQLLQTYERVSEELRDKDADVKKLRKRREFVGVELYAMQQQLAKLQVALEQTHADFNGLGEGRARAELDADAAKQRYFELKGVGDALSKRLIKNESELNSLQDTLRQVELYNEEMKDEILVTRRATYKAEEAVSNLEKDKGRQDLLIDGLMDQVKRLQGQVAVAEAQIGMSQGQTGEADGMLRETAHEMSLIAFEKKQLLQQWKGALVGLARRDEALTAASNALKEAQSAARDYDIEIEGLKRETLKAQEEHEGLIAVRDRLESGRAFVEEQLAKTKEERDSLAERYAMLQRSLAQSEEDEEKLDAMGTQLRSQVDMLSNQAQALTRERQKLEAEAAKRRSQQSTTNKAVKNLVRQARAVVEQLHEIEMEEANLQNEEARVRVDSLNTEAHNLQLKETLRRSEEELNSKDRLIEKYQTEIRQRGDEIEKKMYSVDRLNRQYEKLREAVEEPENVGPLESSVKSLQKEIAALGEENARMKHEWLADQTKLVSSAMETEQLAEKNGELRARCSIVGQRKARLLQSMTSDLAESKRLRSAIEGMHMDMGRLNDLIGKSGRRAHELDDATRALEREFVQELRDLEAESVALEGRIRSVKDLKAETLEQILEAERQVMLWEKKTQLERETQAALDPGVGKSEVRTMEREIHRMRIRLEGLKREQERMIQEMERAIAKREQIAVRHKGKSEAAAGRSTKARRGMLASGNGAAGSGLGDLTTTALKKKVVSLQRQLNASAEETLRYTRAAEDRRNEVGALSSSLQEQAARADETARRGEELRSSINSSLYEKQRLAEVTAVKQRLADNLRGVAKGVMKPVPAHDAMKVEQALLTSEIRLGAVRDVIESMAEKFPHLRDVLGRLSRLSEDATD